MTSKILTLVFFALNIFKVQPPIELPTIIPKPVLRHEILDLALRRIDSSAIIMIRAEKISPNKPQLKNCNLNLGITAVLKRDFDYFHLIEDKYWGYFEYRGHIALVYGDSFPDCFFSYATTKKTFDFLLDSKADMANHRPVVLEPVVYIYRLINGELKMVDGGRIGFYK